MALLDGSPDSGVMFGENKSTCAARCIQDRPIDCEGEILSVERKSGRRAGTFDKLTFRVTVRERGALAPVALCTSSWIFPRRDGGDD